MNLKSKTPSASFGNASPVFSLKKNRFENSLNNYYLMHTLKPVGLKQKIKYFIC